MMLAEDTEKLLEQLIIESKLINDTQLQQVRTQAAQEGKSILSVISNQGLIQQEDLVRLTAKSNNVQYADLRSVVLDASIIALIPKDLAQSYMTVPIGTMQGKLGVGMLDPTNVQAVDFISRRIGKQLIPFMVSEDSISHILGQYKADVSREVTDVIKLVDSIQVDEEELPNAKKETPQNVQNIVQDAPITRALNTILNYAAQLGASDIHVEPREHELKIRYRIDGILQDTMTLPKKIEPALISRIKILSSLKIDEHRIPQDGQFQINAGGHDIDLRIAISPVVWGEQVVIRLLDKSGTILTLDSLGFRGRALRWIEEGIHKPHGMTLSTGPTGSGKSTTLYAVIAAIKNIAINIVTLEDPVEYKMDGINQIQVNADVGLTFAAGLRSILRQDPNVIMVGEIRDTETADLAVQSALTGHVVLSTIHTNSAAGVLPRMLDMGLEPFLIASTINTVVGQRLVRRLCEKCKEEYDATPAEMESIAKTMTGVLPKDASELAKAQEDLGYEIIPQLDSTTYKLWMNKGCKVCVNGYKGRVGIYEVFSMTQGMETLLSKRATTSEVQIQAQKDGMVTMKQDGYLKALNGLTTLTEVARVASES